MQLDPSDQFYHPNTLWYKLYDQQCVSKSLIEVNFSRYIALVTTHPLFQDWRRIAYERTQSWSNKAIALLKILDLLSQFFDPNEIDKRLLYVEDKKLRKLLICFQFWILCERLYALLYYSLDSLEFGDDRNMGTLIRSFKYLCQFFSSYKKIMFEETQVKEFLDKIHRQLMSYQKSQTNRWATILCNNMLSVINRYTKFQEIDELDYKHESYYTIVKEITERSNDTIEDIESRLLRNYEKRQSVLKVNERKRWDGLEFIDKTTEEAKKTYDPKEMQELEKLRLEKEKKRPRRAAWITVKSEPKEGEQKSEITREKQSVVGPRFPKKLMKNSTNNPTDPANSMFNVFIDELVPTEELKNDKADKMRVVKEEKKEDDDEGSNQDIETLKYYDPSYTEVLAGIKSDYAKVTQKDIAEDYEQQQEIKINKENKAIGKIVDEVWIHYEDDDEYWYSNGVYGPVETEVNQKYLRINQIGSDQEDEEEDKSLFRKFVRGELALEGGRERKWNDLHEELNINKLIFQKKKSAWYFVKNLYTQSKIAGEIEDIVKSGAQMAYVYPWDPETSKKKMAIL